MKYSLILFVFIFSIAAFSQPWKLQTANVPDSAIVAPFSPVDDNICWAAWSTSWMSTTEFINGYLKTTDGGATWLCDTIPETEWGLIWWIDAIDANTAFIAVESWADWGMQGVYKTTDGGATWQKHSTVYAASDYGPAYIHFFDDNNGVVVGEQDQSTSRLDIYTTTNGGIDWNQVSQSNIPQNDSVEFLEPVQVAEYGDYIWLPTIGRDGPKLYKTTDKGYSWEIIGIPNSNDDYMMFSAFKNENTGMRIVWRWSEISSILEKTTDGGNTWNEIPGPYGDCIPVNVSYVPGTPNGYVITGDVNVNGYAGGSAYTLDGGTTWTNLDNGNYSYLVFGSANVGWSTNWVTNNFYKYVGPPVPVPVELTSFNAVVNGKQVALKWTTATETNNQGFEVERSQKSIVKSQIKWEKIGFVKGNGTTSEQKNYTYADKDLAYGNYTYRLKQIDLDGSYNYSKEVEAEIKIIAEYVLGQNYPNPFNPTTTIDFGIKNKGNVNIKILNAIGEEVTTIINEEKEAGYYQIEFDASSLSSGVYFYRITAGNYNAVKKMLLMK